MKAANNAPRTGSNAVPLILKDKTTVTCYECGIKGHYSNECPQKLMKSAPNAATVPQQRRIATGWKYGPSYPNNRDGRFYRMTAAEAQEAPNAVMGMFSG